MFVLGMLSTLFAMAFGLPLSGCDDPDEPNTFPCGIHGGRCQIGVEVCVLGDGVCSACRPLETHCAAADGCGCLDGVDFSSGDHPCADAPVCEPSGGGLMVTCAAESWGCG